MAFIALHNYNLLGFDMYFFTYLTFVQIIEQYINNTLRKLKDQSKSVKYIIYFILFLEYPDVCEMPNQYRYKI